MQILTPRETAEKFNWREKEGAVQAYLANFGRYQFGTSFQATAYYPLINTTACEDMTAEAEFARSSKLGYSGAVFVDAGGCSYETKARNIEMMGAQVAIIIEDEPIEDLDTTENLMKQSIYDGTG